MQVFPDITASLAPFIFGLFLSELTRSRALTHITSETTTATSIVSHPNSALRLRNRQQ